MEIFFCWLRNSNKKREKNNKFPPESQDGWGNSEKKRVLKRGAAKWKINRDAVLLLCTNISARPTPSVFLQTKILLHFSELVFGIIHCPGAE